MTEGYEKLDALLKAFDGLTLGVVPVSDIDRASPFIATSSGSTSITTPERANSASPATHQAQDARSCSRAVPDAAGLAAGSATSSRMPRAREELVARGVAAEEIDVIDERDGGTCRIHRPRRNAWVNRSRHARAPTDHALKPARTARSRRQGCRR